jgi:CubicO group peptidase (beta-lactamase class C family)
MKGAVTDGVFPGGVVLAAKNDSLLFFEAYGWANLFAKRPVNRDTVFDLASLTKPLATTLAVLKLVQNYGLDLEQTMGSLLAPFQNTDKARITIRQLLAHTSGLPAYQPYYRKLTAIRMAERKHALRTLLVEAPLMAPAGKAAIYSDLGFMLLNWVVEVVAGKRLDTFLKERIYGPLGIEDLFFVDVDSAPVKGAFAATENCPWRNCVVEGVVHDENAFALGGVEGHAGLFGTARAVYQLVTILLHIYRGESTADVFDGRLIRSFFSRQKTANRALGFDMPSPRGSSSGRFFSNHTVGHLGFTGTSFWMDLECSAIVILLTNRIHPTRDNEKIKEFRPRLHDAIMTM